MEFILTEIENLSGPEATIYTIKEQKEAHSLFEKFLQENLEDNKNEIKNILSRLKQIGKTTGARSSFFKLNEGKYGDNVCALYDTPSRNLRLFCIRYGMDVVILGGGGGKKVRAWQDDQKLSEEAQKIIKIAKCINDKLVSRELKWSDDRKKLIE